MVRIHQSHHVHFWDWEIERERGIFMLYCLMYDIIPIELNNRVFVHNTFYVRPTSASMIELVHWSRRNAESSIHALHRHHTHKHESTRRVNRQYSAITFAWVKSGWGASLAMVCCDCNMFRKGYTANLRCNHQTIKPNSQKRQAFDNYVLC